MNAYQRFRKLCEGDVKSHEYCMYECQAYNHIRERKYTILYLTFTNISERKYLNHIKKAYSNKDGLLQKTIS